MYELTRISCVDEKRARRENQKAILKANSKMSQEDINRIKCKMEATLLELGFREEYINDDLIYFNPKSDYYHTITYVDSLGIVIESGTYKEVVKNIMEDSDVFPLTLGEDKLLTLFREYLIKYYLD